MSDADLPCCPCGTTRYSLLARPKLKFGGWNLVLIFAGGSGRPYEIEFRCGSCQQPFETTRDPDVLEDFRDR